MALPLRAAHVREGAYDVTRDLAVISEVAANNLVLVVNRDLPVKNVKEFMAWASGCESCPAKAGIENLPPTLNTTRLLPQMLALAN